MKPLTQKLTRFWAKHVRPGGSNPEVPPESPALAELRKQAERLQKAGQGVDALRLVEKALASNADKEGLLYLQGRCLEHVGRHEEAVAAYEQELAAHPQHAAAARRAEQLRQALAPPVVKKIPMLERPYASSLPRPTMTRIQQALHLYKYRGVFMLKSPFDMALYPALVWQLKPRTIFEIGSKSGGSGLWFGDMLDSFGLDGTVYSLDIVRVDAVSHPRVKFMEGDGRRLEGSLTKELLESLPRPWLVIEDADHAYETTLAVLRFFHPWLRPGEYIVVEDGIISDLNNDPACNSGPHRALKEFLPEHARDYEIDADYCDFFGYNLTWSSNGILKRL
ncbi:MAG TPA: CmcI family methyltransferase [Opitutales bacterium]|nr:CmcI family methyltransferase [Opitutales bacterium]